MTSTREGEIAAGHDQPFVLGWEEWLGLPELGLASVRAKVDTGARTSALSALAIEPFGPAQRPKVRFLVRPNPDNDQLEVTCSAPIVDQRDVTSSNGETERRYVIASDVVMGGRTWPIEITLTNRESMSYRMLLGRSAVQAGMVVDPGLACVQGVGDYSGYTVSARPKRSLRIAVLTREPDNYSTKRLLEAAAARGHEAECVHTTRCTMFLDAMRPTVNAGGEALPHFDAVIPRIGASVTAYGLAVVRQFEAMGVYCLNKSAAIAASRDKLQAHQLLARHGIGMPATAFARSPKDAKSLIDLAGGAPLVVKLLESTQGRGVVLAETRKAAESLIDAFRNLGADFLIQEFVKEAAGQDIRCLVVGSKVVAAMKRIAASEGEFRSNLHQGGRAEATKLSKDERAIALAAVKAIGLSVGGVDLLRTSDGPKVLEVNSSPGLEGVEKASGKDVADAVIQHVERAAPSITRRASRASAAVSTG